MAAPLVRLAPLDLIRGFVAVGRRMSVTLAAEGCSICASKASISASATHRRAAPRPARRAFSANRASRRPIRRSGSRGSTPPRSSGRSWLEFDGPRRPLLRWSDHLSAMGLADARPRSILRFNRHDQVVQAALAGQGIALGRAALVEPLIAEERLVAPGDGPARTSGYAYWPYRAEDHARQDVLDVAEWIIAEARAREPRLAGSRREREPASLA